MHAADLAGGHHERARDHELDDAASDALGRDVAHAHPAHLAPVPGGGEEPHRATASEQAFGHAHSHAQPRRSTAMPGRTVDINVGGLVGDSTKANRAVMTLVRGLEKKHLSVGAAESGLAKLEAVFADAAHASRLMGAPHTHDSQHLMSWLHHHETGIIPTREHVGSGLANRPAPELEANVAGFLHDHPGAHAMIDEAGTRRFGLVAQTAHRLAHDHPELRGRWGAYFSAAPGGLHTAKVRHSMAELRDAGASAVLEGYTAGMNPWKDEDKRLHQAKTSLGLMRRYFAHPGYAVGADALRLGLHGDHGKAMHRVFLQRLRAIVQRAHHALPGVQLGSWISRLDGDVNADNAELGNLLSAL